MYGYITPASGFTVELWFRHEALPTWPEVMISQQTQNKAVTWSTTPGVNGRQFIIYLAQTTGALAFNLRDNYGASQADWTDSGSPSYANDGNWHHVALRLAADQRTVSFFLDGELQYAVVTLANVDWVPGALALGGTYAPHLGNFGQFLYNGGLAYVAIYDVGLTDAQIIAHYTAGSGGAVFYGDDEVTRLNRLYDFCAVPVSARKFEPALSTLQALQVARENGLDKIKSTAKDASGIVFADGQAVMVYQNRRHRYNRPVIATLTEDIASAPEIGMEFTTDDTKVYNDVRASRPEGGSARLRNRASEDEYGPRVYELSLGITSDAEMRNAGTWMVERYGEDRVRVSGVELSAESSDLIQFIAETVNIGDRIAFDDLPNNVPETYMEFVVEGVSVDANFKDQTWKVGLELSPAELWDVFQVGVSTLGDGSRIAF